MFATVNQTSAKTFSAGAGVELWVADATSAEWLMARINVLSPADREEFATIQQPANRWRSMSARILLRVALSDAVDGTVAANEWTFEKGANGKKRVAEGLPAVHFSVSHNDEMAVVAVSRSHALGVDVEANGADVDEDVVAQFLSASEQASLDQTSLDQASLDQASLDRSNQFVRFWTLKEAFTKLTGEGLSADFAAVEFKADENALANDNDTRFEMFDIAKCQIALAIEHGNNAEVTLRELA